MCRTGLGNIRYDFRTDEMGSRRPKRKTDSLCTGLAVNHCVQTATFKRNLIVIMTIFSMKTLDYKTQTTKFTTQKKISKIYNLNFMQNK